MTGGGSAFDSCMHPLPHGMRWILESPDRVTALYCTQKFSCCYRVSARSVSLRPATPSNGRGGTGMASPAAGSSGSTNTVAGVSLCSRRSGLWSSRIICPLQQASRDVLLLQACFSCFSHADSAQVQTVCTHGPPVCIRSTVAAKLHLELSVKLVSGGLVGRLDCKCDFNTVTCQHPG